MEIAKERQTYITGGTGAMGLDSQGAPTAIRKGFTSLGMKSNAGAVGFTEYYYLGRTFEELKEIDYDA